MKNQNLTNLSRDPATRLPLGWVVEGTSTIQCLCPRCEYGRGYNEPFLASYPVKEIVKCKTCGLEFIALTLGQVGRKPGLLDRAMRFLR